MKNLGNVFRFEFFKLVKSKAFKITTAILSLIIIIGLSVPTIMSAFGNPLFGDDLEEEDPFKFGLVIQDNAVDFESLESQFGNNEVIPLESREELSKSVLSEEVEAGFVVSSPTSYEYVVNNASMGSIDEFIIEDALSNLYRKNTLSSMGIDYGQVEEIYNISIASEVTVLGKDSTENFFYTYILIFGLYFLILFYGQVTATSVASEKSNRSMEILVTSTSTESLIFGKVFAAALAGIAQFITILLVAFIAYRLNINAWNNSLDYIFDVPGNVLGVFAIFGSLGYLLFLFIFGVLGALVSKTEDIGTSSTPITIIFIIGFFISMFGLSNPDMLLVKVASFVPLTSFMAMFVRVTMGTVPPLEIIISLIILAGTTVAFGIIGAKIYRLGTLMYGNPVKIRQAIRLLRED